MARRNKKRIRRALLDDFKSQGCAVCGTRSQVTLHHTRPYRRRKAGPRKPFLDATLGTRQFVEEIAKCVPLCRTHHDLLHDDRLELSDLDLSSQWSMERIEAKLDELQAKLNPQWEPA
jgi:hypothetical protein